LFVKQKPTDHFESVGFSYLSLWRRCELHNSNGMHQKNDTDACHGQEKYCRQNPYHGSRSATGSTQSENHGQEGKCRRHGTDHHNRYIYLIPRIIGKDIIVMPRKISRWNKCQKRQHPQKYFLQEISPYFKAARTSSALSGQITNTRPLS